MNKTLTEVKEDLKKPRGLIKTIRLNIKWKLGEIEGYYYNLKYKIQRFNHGYSDADVYNMSDYLTEILPKMLIRLKEDTHGFPGSLVDNPEKDHTDEEWKSFSDKWDVILDKMIVGFEAAYRYQNLSDYYCDENGLVDNYKELMDKDKIIFEEGMNLFKEFFFALWD